jgi:DNA polymerase-4
MLFQRPIRKIIHVDMDAYYASIEQRDHPEYREKPVIVGGPPHSRGVVATCSYEARKFGIHSAMASKIAYRKCPQAIFVLPRFEVYTAVSQQIRDIFYEYTDLVEPLSLDEAFLDVTTNKKNIIYATQIAKEIRQKIFEFTGLTASAGVSYNKFLAKIASDFRKPNGLTVITPDRAESFIETLPVRKFFGIGKVTEKRMNELGIFTGADLKKWKKEQLAEYFGNMGEYFYEIVRGIDERPVENNWIRQSYGREETFEEDILDITEIRDIFRRLSEEVAISLQKEKTSGKTVKIKVRYANFETLTRQKSLPSPINDQKTIFQNALTLLNKTEVGKRKVRRLGVAITGLS